MLGNLDQRINTPNRKKQLKVKIKVQHVEVGRDTNFVLRSQSKLMCVLYNCFSSQSGSTVVSFPFAVFPCDEDFVDTVTSNRFLY